jgi:hypothetical protein
MASKTLFHTIPSPNGSYATVRRNEHGEFVARLFCLNRIGRAVHQFAGDAFESDLESACGSAVAMAAWAARA